MSTAKFFICLTSFLAFSVTFFIGMMSSNDFIPILRDAAIACLIAAFITRFFVQIIINAVREAHVSHMERVEDEANKAAEASESETQAQVAPGVQEPVTQ